MNGTYLQQTVETVIGNENGKQLMVMKWIENEFFSMNFF